MTTALHVAQARRRRVRWITLLVAVVVLAVVAALFWRWYDGPDQRSWRARHDLEGMASRLSVRDDVLQVWMSPSSSPDDVEEAYDAAARYAAARADAGRPPYAAVRIEDAVVEVGAGREHVDPDALIAAGAWEAPDGVQVVIGRDGDVTTLDASAERAPSVTTLAWLLDHVEDLGVYQAALVGEVSATNDYLRTTSRITRGAPEDSVTLGAPVVDALAAVADLDPMLDLVPPGEGTVDVAVDGDQQDEARRRIIEALGPSTRIQVTVTAR